MNYAIDWILAIFFTQLFFFKRDAVQTLTSNVNEAMDDRADSCTRKKCRNNIKQEIRTL